MEKRETKKEATKYCSHMTTVDNSKNASPISISAMLANGTPRADNNEHKYHNSVFHVNIE